MEFVRQFLIVPLLMGSLGLFAAIAESRWWNRLMDRLVSWLHPASSLHADDWRGEYGVRR